MRRQVGRPDTAAKAVAAPPPVAAAGGEPRFAHQIAVAGVAVLLAPAALLVGLWFEIGLTPVLLLAGAAVVLAAGLARRAVAGPGLTGLGVVVAGAAAWLVPQRPDPASAVALAVTFGVGLGLAHPTPDLRDTVRSRRAWPMVGSCAFVVALAAWSLTSTGALVLAGVFVALAGLFRPDGWLVNRRSPRRAADALSPRRDADAVALSRSGDADAPVALSRGPRADPVARSGSREADAPAAACVDRARRRARRVRVVSVGVFVAVVAGLYVAYLGASTVSASWFGGGVTHGDRGGRQVALTFDDGPNPTATLRVARILDEHGTKGTFFLVGKAVAARPDIVRALAADGQLLGNHSYTHDSWAWLDPWYPELERTDRVIGRAAGRCPVFYRPPHGQRTPFVRRVADGHHERLVMWDVSAQDWSTTDAGLIARRVLAEVRPRSIILLHDGLDGDVRVDRSALVRALPLILDGLKAKGLEAVPLDQLIGGATSRAC